MFEGKYVRWGIWAKGHDLAGMMSIELLERNFDPESLRHLIKELGWLLERLEQKD